MKYLFIVQGEGRGHMTQAIALSAILRADGHEVVEALVGASTGRTLPSFFAEKIGCPVHQFESPNFVMGKNKKKVDMLQTVVRNVTLGKGRAFLSSVKFIKKRIEASGAQRVINFYELLGSLSTLYHKKCHNVEMIGIAHQYLLQHSEFTYDHRGKKGVSFLRLHAHMSAAGLSRLLALSFYPLGDDSAGRVTAIPPLLRDEVLKIKPTTGDHILGYMLNEGYADEVMAWHEKNREIPLHIFWDKASADDEWVVDSTLTFHKINDTKFLKLMASCRGYITTAGFESVCEALYLGKPAMMIPAHVEQSINATDAMKVGAGVVADSFDISKLIALCKSYTPNPAFKEWVDSGASTIVRILETV